MPPGMNAFQIIAMGAHLGPGVEEKVEQLLRERGGVPVVAQTFDQPALVVDAGFRLDEMPPRQCQMLVLAEHSTDPFSGDDRGDVLRRPATA